MRVTSVIGAHLGAFLLAVSAAAFNPLERLPLHFEPNRGQAGADVRYLSRGDGMNIFLAGPEVLLVPHADGSAVVRMKFTGGRRGAVAEGVDPSGGISNYFLGRDPSKWITDVPHYRRVAFRGVYPGVDVVYYGNQRRLEYDMVVAPGADPDSRFGDWQPFGRAWIRMALAIRIQRDSSPSAVGCAVTLVCRMRRAPHLHCDEGT